MRAAIIAVAFLAAGPLMAFEEAYRPPTFDDCDGTISVVVGTQCLTVSGRARVAYVYSPDRFLPSSLANFHLGHTSHTNYGRSAVVFGLEDYGRTEWSYLSVSNDFTLTWQNDLRLTDAYAFVGDGLRITAGLRDRRWGSLISPPDPIRYILRGNFESSYDYGADLYAGWSMVPMGGGHVVQLSAQVSPELTFSAGVEDLERTGLLVGRADYEANAVSAYVAAYRTGVLEQTRYSGVSAGFALDGEATQLRAYTAVQQDPLNGTIWESRGAIEQRLGLVSLLVHGTTYLWDETNPFAHWTFWALAGGMELAYDISPMLTIWAGGGASHQEAPYAKVRFSSVAAGVAWTPVEHLELKLGAETAWRSWDGGPISNEGIASASLTWTPDENFSASVSGQSFSNGAWRYYLTAERRF